MSGSQVFSLLNTNSDIWMIPLKYESSRLCTFNTLFRRYRFLRLPFAISSAPETFHAEMVRLFGDISDLVICMNDSLTHESSVLGFNEILNQVLERAERVCLKFNRAKSMILKTEIKFIGHFFSERGVRPENRRIESILAMPIPENKQEL